MAAKEMNAEAIANALGEPWADVRARLEAAGGASASHKELADALYPQYEGRVNNHGWWVQGAVVAYEQEIGRRVPGQRADGTFEVAVSRTVPLGRDEAIKRFGALIEDPARDGVPLSGDPRMSETPKRTYWRADMAGGARIEAAAEPKAEGRSLLTVTVARLPSPEALEEWRTYFREFLRQI
ncbi:hypothetical protein DFO66_11153 [Brevibacterium sanguinis]|uniref:Uncharacterized protein n=2 Tax=Brevibacterium TaxID=1696 RepID=A0A366IEH6_9MICO|nr:MULTISPECIES: hypothetical protein [Brevibacterium]RBP63132.1 hypothetical protein DFO66_11153 [Brevibacterium sanguinis]RBP69692.1 hypothetical protein DFO65_11153 [Brevibacterium celere]